MTDEEFNSLTAEIQKKAIKEFMDFLNDEALGMWEPIPGDAFTMRFNLLEQIRECYLTFMIDNFDIDESTTLPHICLTDDEKKELLERLIDEIQRDFDDETTGYTEENTPELFNALELYKKKLTEDKL